MWRCGGMAEAGWQGGVNVVEVGQRGNRAKVGEWVDSQKCGSAAAHRSPKAGRPSRGTSVVGMSRNTTQRQHGMSPGPAAAPGLCQLRRPSPVALVNRLTRNWLRDVLPTWSDRDRACQSGNSKDPHHHHRTALHYKGSWWPTLTTLLFQTRVGGTPMPCMHSSDKRGAGAFAFALAWMSNQVPWLFFWANSSEA